MRRFTGRDAVFRAAPDAPKLIFPPDGALLALEGGIPVKVRDGTPPFTWLANGRPLRTGVQRRNATLPSPGEGFSQLAVIDALGRVSRVTIRVD